MNTNPIKIRSKFLNYPKNRNWAYFHPQAELDDTSHRLIQIKVTVKVWEAFRSKLHLIIKNVWTS